MRLELDIPDSELTPNRRNKLLQFFERVRSEPALIDRIRIGASTTPGGKKTARSLTSKELDQLKELDGTFGLLEDMPDEAIDRIEAGILKMKEEGFPIRD